MRFYRLHCRCEGGISGGVEWFTSRRQAERSRREHIANAKLAELDQDFLGAGENEPDEIEELDITPTKSGILLALKRYASHPDNG